MSTSFEDIEYEFEMWLWAKVVQLRADLQAARERGDMYRTRAIALHHQATKRFHEGIETAGWFDDMEAKLQANRIRRLRNDNAALEAAVNIVIMSSQKCKGLDPKDVLYLITEPAFNLLKNALAAHPVTKGKN